MSDADRGPGHFTKWPWVTWTVGECLVWLRCRVFGHRPAWDLGMGDNDPIMVCLRCRRGLRGRGGRSQ